VDCDGGRTRYPWIGIRNELSVYCIFELAVYFILSSWWTVYLCIYYLCT
jgi:hypothetical protein